MHLIIKILPIPLLLETNVVSGDNSLYFILYKKEEIE